LQLVRAGRNWLKVSKFLDDQFVNTPINLLHVEIDERHLTAAAATPACEPKKTARGDRLFG
jgi:hypothetical protein